MEAPTGFFGLLCILALVAIIFGRGIAAILVAGYLTWQALWWGFVICFVIFYHPPTNSAAPTPTPAPMVVKQYTPTEEEIQKYDEYEAKGYPMNLIDDQYKRDISRAKTLKSLDQMTK